MSAVLDEVPEAVIVPPEPVSHVDKNYVVENRTARSIQIAAIENAADRAPLIIPPFGARRITAAQYQHFDFQRWEDPGLIVSSLEPDQVERAKVTGAEVSFYTIVAAVLIGCGPVGCAAARHVGSGSVRVQDQTGLLSQTASVLRALFPFSLLLVIAAPLLLVGTYLARRRTWFSQGGRALALAIIAISVIGVAAIGPVLIMVSFSMKDVLVTGRMLQMIFIVIAALLPAMLYFLYDRQKVSIVSKTFYREIVLLDPAIHTSADAEEKYGHLINEVYGDKSAGYYLANVGLPITLSSVLIALGWLLILLPLIPTQPQGPADFFNLVSPHADRAEFRLSGRLFLCAQHGLPALRAFRSDAQSVQSHYRALARDHHPGLGGQRPA